MALLRFKSTVKVPKVVIIASAVVNAANTLVLPDMLCTSGNDSMHKIGSKHYSDEALDFRTKHLSPPSVKRKLVAEIKRRLGADYDVILESEGQANEHLHIEHDA